MRTLFAAVALGSSLVLIPPVSAAAPAVPLAGAQTSAGDLRWAPCSQRSLQQQGMECARLKVPLDRRKPRGATTSLALIRHRSTGSDPIGSLLFNPGGPGGVSSQSIDWVWANLSDEVKARFDLVTWDARGLGLSKPLLKGCRGPLPARDIGCPNAAEKTSASASLAAGVPLVGLRRGFGH